MVARRFSAVYMTRLWPKLREAEGTGEKFLLKKNNQKATLLFKYTLIYLVVDIKGFLFSFFFLAAPAACRSFWARNPTCAMGVT